MLVFAPDQGLEHLPGKRKIVRVNNGVVLQGFELVQGGPRSLVDPEVAEPRLPERSGILPEFAIKRRISAPELGEENIVDQMRRRGKSPQVPIEDVSESLAAEDTASGALDGYDVSRMLDQLNEKQRNVVRFLTIEGASVRQTAERLNMTEGAIRVTLHRAVKALAVIYREQKT